MLKRLDRIAAETLGALHREAIEDSSVVHDILRRAALAGTTIDAGIDRKNEPRRGAILSVAPDGLQLALRNAPTNPQQQLYFSFTLEGGTYFFASSMIESVGPGVYRAAVPAAIYRSERRDISRSTQRRPETVACEIGGRSRRLRAEVVDRSLQGLAVRLPSAEAEALPSEFRVTLGSEPKLYARVRHKTGDAAAPGWTRVGMSVSRVRTSKAVQVERRERILEGRSAWTQLRSVAQLGLHSAAKRLGFRRGPGHEGEIVDFENDQNQPMRGIVNGWGPQEGATAIVIPPAWGRTKETLMPLALTIVETFKRAHMPVRVLRFDGTNRRGESHIDPECRVAGSEYLHFRFSQASRDISSAIDYVISEGLGSPSSKVVLVTFSLASVEGRNAMVREQHRVAGWISVVGVADLQSALRTISGGVDYGFGLLNGARFGRHELVGVIADMDLTGLDAIEHKIGFLEDARRDMAEISTPITWLHGRHDAWMDLDRVAEILSCGDTRRRKLLEVPTGHQLRSSQAALETFRLIAEEASEMALGRRLKSATPSAGRILETRASERRRLAESSEDVRSFWEDYLLGRDRTLGMELLTATAAYRNFLETELGLLELETPARVIDLGAGTGELALGLTRRGSPGNLSVLEVDFVGAALKRARERRGGGGGPGYVSAQQCMVNLSLHPGRRLPFESSSFDAALASLVIGYLDRPDQFLREVFRLLKPGGRVVVSSMLEDADISMLFHDGLVEYATEEARQALSSAAAERFDEIVRNFLNDGSRLLDLEERGTFRFWSAHDLRYALANAGFVKVHSVESLGDPPQAVIVGATRP